jgi:restriction endonuclease S subunit
LVTWGGRGLDTGKNEEHIAYIDGTYEAEQVKERNDDFTYVEKNEDAFRWVSRVIQEKHTIDPQELTEEEKKNGIDPEKRGERTWVPLEKGSSIEDIYYKPTLEYIDWSQESLQQIRDRRAGRLRDTDYYFREALFSSRGGTGEYKAKVRYINNAVVDGSGVVLIPTTDLSAAKYLNGVLNSDVMKYIIDEFINSTVNVQVSDMRLLPILIPTNEERNEIVDLVDEAIAIQKGKKDGEIEDIHQSIEEKVKGIYEIDVEYQAT